jgi:argininosuccinate lyase
MNKFANDLILFTSQEFKYFKIDDCLTTGSSIMPQKRNMDILEVMRANLSIIQSLQIQTQTVYMNLISGYNKDLKITKESLMKSFDIVLDTLDIASVILDYLEPIEEHLVKVFEDSEIFATDYAYDLVMKGMSFRDAYLEVGSNLNSLESSDPYKNIKSKTHLGSTGNLGIDIIKKRLKKY